MSDVLLMVLFLISLLAIIASGVWIGVALLIGACLAMMMFSPLPYWPSFVLETWDVATSWSLTSLPLFILMGEILARTKLGENLFQGLTPLCRRLPGGLLHVNVAGSAFFSTITGSSAATVSTVGKITIPELKQRGFSEQRILGTLAGAGTLGLLIPPSITLIVYGITANVSVADLFIAGVLPGIVLAILFMLYIAITSGKDKHTKSSQDNEKRLSFFGSISLLMPIISLMFLVMGSIYGGYATPTEAAAIGVTGALIIAYKHKVLTWKLMSDAALNAVCTTAMIALILLGSSMITMAMEFTGIPTVLAKSISTLDISKPMLIIILTLFYILLGCFLDGISSITLTMSVIQPLLLHYGIDLIWFGIFIIIVVEMAQITPPIGINLFVLQSMTGKSIASIARATTPMFFIMLSMIGVIYVFPELIHFLIKE